jgi:hypothetical protein
MSDQQDRGSSGDSTTSIVVTFILVVIATTGILWKSGTIYSAGLR